MNYPRRVVCVCSVVAVVLALVSAITPAQAEVESRRLDCGSADSPLMPGYQRLSGDDAYDEAKGYGWERGTPEGVLFGPAKGGRKGQRPWEQAFIDENSTALTRDGVVSEETLTLRADVPNGTYRVTVVVGDLSEHLGAIDVHINGKLVGNQVAPWAPGGYRTLLRFPMGWWRNVRDTVEVKDGILRIALSKNQSRYDREMAEQSAWEESPYESWRAGDYTQEPPYYFIGWPFVRDSVMAVDILPYMPPPVVGENDKLRLVAPLESRTLNVAISRFNDGDFMGAAEALKLVREPAARVARAVVQLWLAGRLEVEMEEELVPAALEVLRGYVKRHPEENGVAELVADAEIFHKALTTHLTRGEVSKNHGIENDKAVGLWLTINEGTPLYYKSQLYAARAAHMLVPYLPMLGMEGQIMKKLGEKFPDNRYVKFFNDLEWEPYGDGSRWDDWVLEDYYAQTEGSPEWARRLQAALASQIDWAEWWIKFKQRPDGSVGGGWGDDVEVVGGFAIMAYVSKGVSPLAFEGTRKLVDGVWSLVAGVDPEIGYCLPNADVQHTAEWTGNTLGLMVTLDPGNPKWIERSFKTGRLMRDLWTARNEKGLRQFRANFIGAAQVGGGDQMNDAWINLRALQPLFPVLKFNQSPGISDLFVELADTWHSAAMSTDRGKPKGVIPAQISFPQGIIGGTNSPNWYTAMHVKGATVNYDWAGTKGQRYKNYIQNLFVTAYKQTGDTKYLEPLKLEYELAARYGKTAEPSAATKLLYVPWERGARQDTRDGLDILLTRWQPKYWKPQAEEAEERSAETEATPESAPEEGSEEWVAGELKAVNRWLAVKPMVEGREVKLEGQITKEQIIDQAAYCHEMMKMRFPLMTSMASATDRVGFLGFGLPFSVYTGGGLGDASVTYEDTTKYFAAALMASDPQGFRILYHSMTPEKREIGIVPRELEPGGRYRLKHGPDADEDGVMDSVAEEREFVLTYEGMAVRLEVEPRVTYVIEADQLEKGRPTEPAPDPGLSAEDIRWEELRYGGIILAKVHNVGSKRARDVAVAFYDGDPEAGGTEIGRTLVPNIEAPNDLEPRAVTIGVNWAPREDTHEIYVVVDPDDEIKDEITTLNNVAHTTLPKVEKLAADEKRPVASPSGRGR